MRNNKSILGNINGNGNIVSYYPLSETSFGQPAGLFGINCGHVQYPFIPGINIQRYFPYNEDANAERYKQFQKQRAMERAIRKTKRALLVADTIGNSEEFTVKSVLLRRQREAYEDFSKSAGLLEQNERNQVVGYGRGIAQRASRVGKTVSNLNNEGLTKGGVSGKMKMGKVKNSSIQKPPDFSKYPVRENHEEVFNAKQLLTQEFGLSDSRVDLSGIVNGDVILPFAQRLVKIKNDTGFQLPAIKALDIIDDDVCCIASYSPYSNVLYISNKYFNSKNALVDTLKQWATNDILPKQALSINYLAEHEAAHIRIADSVVESNEAVKIWKKRKLTNKNDNDIYEFFADVVAIHRTSTVSDNNIQKAIDYLTERGVIV